LEHGLAFDNSPEDEDMTRPTMIREVDVKAHPNELPTLVFEFAQMLLKHSRVKPRIHARQVPDVDCVLDRPHQTHSRVQLVYCWWLTVVPAGHELRRERVARSSASARRTPVPAAAIPTTLRVERPVASPEGGD
jgi:hypothetical protein